MTQMNGHSELNGHNGELSNGTMNGHVNGHTNGQTNGHTNGHPLNRNQTEGINGSITNGHSTQSNGHTVPIPIPTAAEANAPKSSFEPIAICGMACRLPGGIASPSDLWEFLLEGGDARSRVPMTRFNIDGYYNAHKTGSANCQYGYFLDESVDLAGLDTSFFSMSRRDVEWLDPQQRLMLEVARESVDDAGEVNFQGSSTGVYIGSFANDWYDIMGRDPLHRSVVSTIASHDFMISERISHEMDLRGPSMTIRTACSSALVSLNEACMAIGKGDCESAIVGGTSLILAPDLLTRLADQGIISPNGSCKTFSAEANGYARGEAIVSIYIKSLSAAIRDGNPIRSIISGAAANFDGKTNPLTNPSITAQETLIRRAYSVAGIRDISMTAVFECHGTGTATGDPIETEAIAAVFGEQGIYLGSVKPNLGHSESASGLTAVLKATLSLEHKVIAPNIKYSPVNPKIPFERAKLVIPKEPTPWPAGRDERISINSFGVGGSNAHAIVESVESFMASHPQVIPKPVAEPSSEDEGPRLLLFSAKTTPSLKAMTASYEALFDSGDVSNLSDIAYTLATRREHFSHRSFAIATKENIQVSTSALSRENPSSPSSLIMVFSGQGAAWPQLGRELLLSNSVFSGTISALQEHLGTLGSASPTWSLAEEIFKPARTSRIYEAEFSQPLCTALQIALIDTFASVGVRPDAVVGHSSGEIAAAYAAGALTAREAIIIAFFRGSTTAEQKNLKGGMAAVGLGWADAEKHLKPGVVIACDNSPTNVTISGDIEPLQAVVAEVKEAHPGIPATTLKVDKAYHSHHMLGAGDIYHAALVDSGVIGKAPQIPFFSSVTGELLSGTEKANQLGPKYWQTNLERPVLFRSAVSSIITSSEPNHHQVFLELGPHSALAGPLRQILTDKASKASYVPSLVRKQDSVENFLQAIGKLYTLHMDVDLKSLFPTGSCVAGLPCYPWNHQNRLFFESRLAKEWREREFPDHNLLGIRSHESTSLEPSWRNLLQVSRTPWIADHKIGETIVFPFAGYIAIASEACRQITGIQEGVSLRNVKVHTALVIEEDGATEIVTTLRRVKLTEEQDSEWWEFSVSSHNGHVWIKHCWGQVRGEQNPFPEKEAIKKSDDVLPREVNASKWYEVVSEEGLTYGPTFNTMKSICTSTKPPHQASTTIQNGENRWDDASEYHMHPIVLDTFYQLVSCTSTLGICRSYRRLVASSIEFMTMARCNDERVSIEVSSELGQDLVGSGTVFSGSKPVMRVINSHSSFFEEGDVGENAKVPITARCEWVPDIDFKSLGDLVKCPEDTEESFSNLTELSRILIAQAQRLASSVDVQVPHLIKYKNWLDKVMDPNLAASDDVDLANISKSLSQKIQGNGTSPARLAAEAMIATYDKLRDLLSQQETEVTELDSHSPLEMVSQLDISNFLLSLGNKKPTLRVLDFYSESIETTSKAIEVLTRNDGTRLFSKYTIATPLLGMSEASSEHLKKLVPDIEFTTLDLSQSLADQGFDDRQFDLIIASGAVSSARDAEKSLESLRNLLSPAGRLLLQEPRPDSLWVKFILGTTQRWWSHEDGRIEGPIVDSETLQRLLETSNFANVEQLSLAPWAATVVVARREPKITSNKRITLLCHGGGPSELTRELEAQGYAVDRCFLDQTPPLGQDIMAVLDEQGPFIESMDADGFTKLKTFVNSIQNPNGLLWVTRQSSVECQDPRFAQTIGFTRTLRNETSTDIAACEVDSITSPENLATLVKVLVQFQTRSQDGVLGPDLEYVIRKGEVLVNRIFPAALDKELEDEVSESEAYITMTQPGRMESLFWASQPPTDPKDNEIEVEVYASGLNFRYVLVAMGIIPPPKSLKFGYEAAGVVRRVGSNVTKLRPGDRTVFVGEDTFSTVVRVPELLAQKLPDDVSFVEASAIPIVFLTAVYGLIDLGRLTRGQSVLIHSGCGGVGLAAIQAARMLGADIYTTVGSEAKVEYLTKTFDIPRSHIFSSRDASFATDLLRETGGKGVDVALNSLSGELLHTTWKCIAKWGTMVEISKRDLLGNAQLDMSPFLQNRNYCCMDVDQLRAERPEVINRLLSFIMNCFSNRILKPIRVDQVFPGSAVLDAFRHMRQGKHMGKIVLEIRDATGKPLTGPVQATKRTNLQLDGSASYLLVGGLGGLGRALSVWMVERGARNLVFLSRSAGGSTQHDKFKREIESMGCSVQFIRGDVTNAGDVTRAIGDVSSPLKGIIQMSMVLRDRMFEDMTFQEWETTTRPKVQGTWNLHKASLAAQCPLDFFLLFSSLSGILGQVGQANYASANTFLDAFARYRAGMGLPCTSLDLGAMEGIGYLDENQDLLRKMKGTGWRPVCESELVEALNVALMPPSSPQEYGDAFLLGVAPTVPQGSAESSTRLSKDVRMAAYHNIGRGQSGALPANDGLRAFLSSVKKDPGILNSHESVNTLALEIGKKLASLLLTGDVDLDISMNTADMGLDSLVAIELRGWWKLTFGFEISTLEMLSMGTLEALGKRTADGLKGLYDN
ncbi:polyketide synthase [Fusarium phyllophilum]|uniref:Polyketide synthase n=1 Tax=Fusarium phyllophilum TaxID=47803 RepID=A0A8H5N3H3_9HYPO|nr:polyketide synthase [Fusarium phyllophilum]